MIERGFVMFSSFRGAFLFYFLLKGRRFGEKERKNEKLIEN